MTYMQQMRDDVSEYIHDNNITVTEETRDEVYETLCEDLWVEDSVTGNASGSYTFSRAKAKEYFLEDGEQYLADMVTDLGMDEREVGHLFINQDWEWFDVSVRCFLLSSVVEEVLEEMLKA